MTRLGTPPALVLLVVLLSGASAPSTAAAGEDSWAFVPAAEGPEPLLDLRPLNEARAGEHGFVRVSPDGSGFVRGDGVPIRFWPAQTNANRFGDAASGARHARWLARLGVNLARIGGGTLNPKQAGAQPDDIDAARLENTWRAVAALKEQGIYALVMPYWVGKGSDVTGWGIDGYGGKDELWGLLFFNPQVQAAYRSWLRRLLTTPNPHTGIALRDDPAVAAILLQNEDSLLFWTFSGIREPQRAILGRRFAAWAISVHGSLERALAAWAGCAAPGDDAAGGVLGFLHIWDLTQDQRGGKAARAADQTRFLAETMRAFNADTIRWLREELGCRHLVAAENWMTANQARLGDCERWAYAAGEVIAKNHYVNGRHQGAKSGWRVEAQDLIANRSVLTEPSLLPISTRQVAGHPSLITECAWVHPNLYQAEGPFLAAAYGSLTGHAGLFWFAAGSETWDAGMGKWGFGHPMCAAQWPAAALVYRQGHVRPGPVVLREERPLADLWQRRPPAILEGQATDPNRDRDGPTETGRASGAGHPLAFLVGRVEVAYGTEAAAVRAADLAPFLDPGRRTVRSATGELTWDYGRGICRMDTPCAQGVAGFLDRERTFALSTLRIESEDPYAVILAVSLDGRPLAEAGRVLVQVGTTARPTGWRTEPAVLAPSKGDPQTIPAERILATGSAPWRVAAVRARIELANPHVRRARLLDGSGAAARTVPADPADGRLRLVLPPDSLHLVLDDGADP